MRLETWNIRFRKYRGCTIRVAKTKALISFAITVTSTKQWVWSVLLKDTAPHPGEDRAPDLAYRVWRFPNWAIVAPLSGLCQGRPDSLLPKSEAIKHRNVQRGGGGTCLQNKIHLKSRRSNLHKHTRILRHLSIVKSMCKQQWTGVNFFLSMSVL